MSITLRVQGSPQSLSNEPSRAACWHEHSPREAFPQAMDLVLVLEHLNQTVSQQNPDCSTDPQRKLKEDLGNTANSPRQGYCLHEIPPARSFCLLSSLLHLNHTPCSSLPQQQDGGAGIWEVIFQMVFLTSFKYKREGQPREPLHFKQAFSIQKKNAEMLYAPQVHMLHGRARTCNFFFFFLTSNSNSYIYM